MCTSPFDLIETDLNVERVDFMCMFKADKFFVDYIRIFQLMATFYIQQTGRLE